ncbi:FliH/SctL family protein [Listeria costaricensis]|uniref:FliH/SctL family protein n=1 Tax=Listeria costaricensis TaxID=2026604 RepID=UPI000C0864F5|nr:FliH/SctL family protein [Listeria costaricensis]
MSSSSRHIKKEAISLQKEAVELVYLEAVRPGQAPPEETDPREREFQQLEANVTAAKAALHQEKAAFEAEKAQLQASLAADQAVLAQARQKLSAEQAAFEAEKKQLFIQINEFLYEKTIDLAEQVVHQALDQRSLQVMPLLAETIAQLPISFERLSVTVHPETLEALKREEMDSRFGWLFENIDWHFDLRLAFGEFTVEEEKEFFDYHFGAIFAALREQNQERLLTGETDD